MRAEALGVTPYDRTMTSGPGGVQAPPRRTRRRIIVSVVILAVLLWTAAAGYQLVQAKNHAQAGLDQLQSAQDGLDAAALIRGKGLPAMRSARTEFHQAADAADSTFLTPFQVLPYVGRQVRSVKALTGSASTVVDVGVTAMERSTTELAAKTESGADRIALLDRLGVIGREAADGLRSVGLGPNEALVGPLERARRQILPPADQGAAGDRRRCDRDQGCRRNAQGSVSVPAARRQRG